jgi:tetratricopeptide (TPR) repeat protein
MKSLLILSVFVCVSLSLIAQPSAQEKQELERKLNLLNEAFARKPYQMGYIFDRAFVFVQLERWEEAIADFTLLLNTDPGRVGPESHAYIFSWRGRMHFELEELDKAMADFTSSIQIYAHNPEPYFYRGMCQLIYGKYDQGCADYHAAVKNGLYDMDEFNDPAARQIIEEFFAECMGSVGR